MKRHAVFCIVIILIVMLAGFSPLRAQWTEDGFGVCRAVGEQADCVIASDGSGGSIIAWRDLRDGSAHKIFAQRLDACGNPLWSPGGIPICSAVFNQFQPAIVPDGAGGAIIAWEDHRSGGYDDIYAQRVDAGGTLLWVSTGVAISAAAFHQDVPVMVSDGSGGAIITWRDIRNGFDYDVYAQRVDPSGMVQWTTDGVSISATTNHQTLPAITTDGSGGAIISWSDTRNGNYDIYAQRVNTSGTVQWTINGVGICTATNTQNNQEMVLAASGGAIIVWYDFRSGTNSDIYAQKIDVSGTVQWTVNGIAICNAAESQSNPVLIPVSSGGALIAWSDGRDATHYHIYAQRIDANGNFQWAYRGIPVCTESGNKYMECAVPDGNDAMIMFWQDLRSATYYDVYTQKLDQYGEILWTATGVPVSTADEHQLNYAAVTDGKGGAIVVWEDSRSGSYNDIFAQRLDADGCWGCPVPEIISVGDVPQDQGGYVNIAWNASQYDPLGEIVEYTIWRALDIPQAMVLMARDACLLESPADIPSATTGPVLREGLLYGEPYYWEMIDSHDAYFIDTYSKIVRTAFDSTATSNDYHYFQIIAHSAAPSVFWVSEPDSGYSADNLAPCIPLSLAGEQMFGPTGLQLTWDRNTEPDMDCYNVYRGIAEEFTPGPGNLLAAECDTALFDGGWEWDGGYFYKVAAVDVHGNESPYALLRPNQVTGDDPMPLPDATFLAQNFPNPFNPVTNIGFGIKESGHISIRIYDAAGRLVTTLVDEARPAGRYTTEWNGQNTDGSSAASGVYFYRLTTREFEETKKMILLR